MLRSASKNLKEAIEDPLFEICLKRIMSDFCQRYNFYDALKSYFASTNTSRSYHLTFSLAHHHSFFISETSMFDRYTSVNAECPKDMQDDDYLSLFKALASDTTVYSEDLNNNQLANIYVGLFGPPSQLRSLKGVLFYFLEHPRTNINFHDFFGDNTDLHYLVSMPDIPFYTKAIEFWLAHPQINVNI